jgi:hypothetical protein
VEHGVTCPRRPEQVIELRPALVVKNDDLAIEHGLCATTTFSYGFIRSHLEDIRMNVVLRISFNDLPPPFS